MCKTRKNVLDQTNALCFMSQEVISPIPTTHRASSSGCLTLALEKKAGDYFNDEISPTAQTPNSILPPPVDWCGGVYET